MAGPDLSWLLALDSSPIGKIAEAILTVAGVALEVALIWLAARAVRKIAARRKP